jgi:hypothetical protein
MNARQTTKKTSSTTRWLSWMRTLLMLYVLTTIVLHNRERILQASQTLCNTHQFEGDILSPPCF